MGLISRVSSRTYRNIYHDETVRMGVGGGLFGLLWLAMLNGYFFTFGIPFFHVQFLPIYAVLLFGIYSVVVILYRVATFNDCPEAAEELRKQISQAKQELGAKGFEFASSKSD